jgi:inosine/xanthosine triphosphatase
MYCMKTILVASTNPIKIDAVRLGFERMFPSEQFSISSISVPSEVSDQPMSDAETRQGALSRATSARAKDPSSDYWVGIEGGVDLIDRRMVALAWVAILSCDQQGISRSGTFFLPPLVVELILAGKELGDADDIVFGRSNSKQLNGAIGLLSGDALDRTGLYAQTVLLALLPFKSPQYY